MQMKINIAGRRMIIVSAIEKGITDVISARIALRAAAGYEFIKSANGVMRKDKRCTQSDKSAARQIIIK